MKRSNTINGILCGMVIGLMTLCGILLFRLSERSAVPAGDPTKAKLSEAVQVLRDYYVGELDEAHMADAAVAAMVASLNDRWSYYLSAEELTDYLDSMNNQYGGLGIVVSSDADGIAVVQKVHPHSPAGEAGVPAGSHFLSAGGRDLSGKDMETVTEWLRSLIAEGLVELTVQTPEGDDFSCSLIPGEVLTDPVSYSKLDSGYGYIRIENFEARCAAMAIAAVESLMQQGVPGIVFDVRLDPGGQLTELLQLLDYLLPEGELFRAVSADGREEIYSSEPGWVTVPAAVLVDADSYSAAEFFAAALADYDRAVIVGSHTSGKGAAQVTVTLSDLSAIHISNIYYFTPSGQNLADIGLAPDITVELAEEKRAELYYGMLDPAEDAQLLAAVEALRAENP